jgi:hypothetical protein
VIDAPCVKPSTSIPAAGQGTDAAKKINGTHLIDELAAPSTARKV